MPSRITGWHRAVKIAMVDKNISFADLEKALGLSRTYLSAVINGRIYSDTAAKRISEFLSIPDGDITVEVKYKPKTR